MAFRKVFAAFVFIGLLESHAVVNALKCFVGRGNSSAVLPSTALEQGRLEKEGNDGATFGIYTCGERGADLPIVERIARNATDLIQAGLTGILRKASDAFGGDNSDHGRRKRQSDDHSDDYACVKVTFGGEAYRSCVPKISNMIMNCTGGHKLAVCYCHKDNCNGAGVSLGNVFLMAAAAYVLSYCTVALRKM